MPAIRNPKGMSYFHTLVTLPTLAPHLAAAAEHEPNGLSGIEGLHAPHRSLTLSDPSFSPDEVEGLEVENHPPVSSGRTGVLSESYGLLRWRKPGPKLNKFPARAAAQASSSTASSASTQNSGMNHTAALPFFMQPGATAAAGNAASGAAPTNAMATPNVEAVAGGPEPGTSVITVLDDDEDDVAIQAGITVSNNMVHRMQSSALLNSNQSSASAASSSKSNNRDARGKGKGKGKRKSIATTDERAMMTLANLHEKGQVLLTGNVSYFAFYLCRTLNIVFLGYEAPSSRVQQRSRHRTNDSLVLFEDRESCC